MNKISLEHEMEEEIHFKQQKATNNLARTSLYKHSCQRTGLLKVKLSPKMSNIMHNYYMKETYNVG